METRPQTFQDLMAQIGSHQRELKRIAYDDSEKFIQLQQHIHSLPMIFQWMEKIMEAIEQEAQSLSQDTAPFLLAKYATDFSAQKIIELTSMLNVMSNLLTQFKSQMADDSNDYDSSDSEVSDPFTKMFGVDIETLENTIMHCKESLKKANEFSLKCLAAEVKVAAIKIKNSSLRELLESKEETSKKRTADEAKLSDSPSPLFKQPRKSEDTSIPAHDLRKR